MTLEEMKKIAAFKTPGGWSNRFGYQGGTSGQYPTGLGPACQMNADGEYQAEYDAAFIAMAANNWEKLLTVVEAARSVIEFVNPMFCDTDECLINLREALAALERE